MTKQLSVLVIGMLAACGGSKPAEVNNAGGGTAAKLEWRASQGQDENVNVTLVVAGQEIALGKLNAASDDAPGTPSTCSVGEKSTATSVEFTCGATPAYNYFVAELKGGELVISLVTGVDQDPGSEKRAEVKRLPATFSSLTVAPYVKPAPQASNP